MRPIWLLRMARWARNPPSEKRVRLVLSVLALSLGLVAFERLVGWPEWLTPDPLRPRVSAP